MDLLFPAFEVITVGLAVAIVSLVAADGESIWMKGVLLLAVLVVFAIALLLSAGEYSRRLIAGSCGDLRQRLIWTSPTSDGGDP